MTGHTEAAELAAPLDALLVDAALGPVRRFAPDLSTLKFAGSLARHPRTTTRRLGSLGAEAVRIAAGTSTSAPSKRDRRFTDPAWAENPVLRRLVQGYLAGERTVAQLLDDAHLDWRDEQRTRFLVENLMEAVSPSNLPLVNPASAKAAVDTAGISLVKGAAQFVRDMASSPRIPEMVDRSAFEVGGNIAATPGAVVLRTEVLELIQYTPQTEQVRAVPLLVVPPTINKFYALDLAPGRSLVEFLVREGQQVFVISWRNPDARHADWDFDTYVQAILDALDAVERVTGTDATALAGICAGGILASIAAAYLAATGQAGRLAAFTLAVTVIDSAQAGAASALVDRGMATAAKALSRRRGYLDGRALAEVFAWLRPGDLIWNYWVNNYLLGKKPPAFDILYWNGDTTRMAAALHADFVDLALDNALTSLAPSPCSACRSTCPRSAPTPTSWPASPTTSRRGRTATAPPSCWAARPSSRSPPAGTSPRWSTRRETPRRATRSTRTTRRTRPSGSNPRRRNRAPGGSTCRPGWPSAAARSDRRPGSWAGAGCDRSRMRRAPTSSTAEVASREIQASR